MQVFLLEDMRIDLSALMKLSKNSLTEIAHQYQNTNVHLLVDTLKDMS
jgi:hypothetical protein